MFQNNGNLFIPKSVDLESLTDSEKERNHIAFILSKIVFKNLRKKGDGYGFIQLQSKEMEKMIGRNYAKTINLLFTKGIIHRSGRDYSVEKKRARAYRIAPEIAESGLKAFKVSDRILRRKINKISKEAQKLREKRARQKYGDMFDKKKFEKEYKWTAEESIRRMTIDDKAEEEIKNRKPTKMDKGNETYWNQCKDLLEEDGGFTPYVSPSSGRLFYIGCSFFKEVRKHFLLDGEETIEIDLACSQPFLAASLYPSYPEAKKEKEKFLKFVRNDFYKELQKVSDFGQNRDDFKKTCYRDIFFGSAEMMKFTELGKLVEEKFPILHDIIYKIKKNNPNPPQENKKKKKKGNIYFANKLQEKEADCIFTSVGELKKLDIPCITVHDSIIVKKKDRKVTEEILMRIIKGKTGEYPQFKIG